MDPYVTGITGIDPYTFGELLMFFTIIVSNVLIFVVKVYIAVLVILALRKYLKLSNENKKKLKEKKSLGESIKEHRIKSKTTQEFIAETLGVEKETVVNWENGSEEPSVDNMFYLAKLFEVPVSKLFLNVTNKYN